MSFFIREQITASSSDTPVVQNENSNVLPVLDGSFPNGAQSIPNVAPLLMSSELSTQPEVVFHRKPSNEPT